MPTTATPSAYRLSLTPDLIAFTFDGSVEIDVETSAATDVLILNAAELDIDAASVSTESQDIPVEISLDAEAERLTLQLSEPLPVGTATVSLSFSGVLNDQLRGFYRSTYRDGDDNEVTIATTQFQSTDARRCFPCWDEPAYKATFEVELIVDPAHLAISNTEPVTESMTDDGLRRRVRFAPTMIMSTYLVAFVVGPLEATTNATR